MKKLNPYSIALEISKKTDMPPAIINSIVDGVFDVILELVKQNYAIRIPEFGLIYLKKRKGRRYSNMVDKKIKVSADKYVLHLKSFLMKKEDGEWIDYNKEKNIEGKKYRKNNKRVKFET